MRSQSRLRNDKYIMMTHKVWFKLGLTLIGLGFFDIFRFGEGADTAPPPIIFVVCGPIKTNFCTGIDNQSISSNMENLHKSNDVIDNNVIIVRKLAEKTVKGV